MHRSASADETVSAQDEKIGIHDAGFAKRFLETYCIDCHTPADPAGDRDLESLNLVSESMDDQILLRDVIDQLTLGAMPPDDVESPPMRQRLAAIEQLRQMLRDMQLRTQSTAGQAVLRRLNRREYRNTLRSLLPIPGTTFDPTENFPAENVDHQIDTIGAALVTSGYLLDRYLEAANRAVDFAFDQPQDLATRTWVFEDGFDQQTELRAAHKAAFEFRYLCLYDHPLADKPEGAYGTVPGLPDGVPATGTYEVTVWAAAKHRDSRYGPSVVRLDREEPFRLGIRPGETRRGGLDHAQPVQPLLAQTQVTSDDFQAYTFKVHLDQGWVPRMTFENGIDGVRQSFGRVFKKHRELLPQSVRQTSGIFRQRIAVIEHGELPHIRIDKVVIRGPLDDSARSAARKRWLQPFAAKSSDAKSSDAKSSDSDSLHAASLDPVAAADVIAKFADAAFRRPANPDTVARYTGFFEARKSLGRTEPQAMLDTFKAILCSPDFLYFSTASPEGRLDDYAIAERLAYFLSSAPPDAELSAAAAAKHLNQPAQRRQHTERLLKESSAETFVSDFCDAWLNLRALGSMPPDPNDFREYYAGDLESDMRTETRLFVLDLIRRDRPIGELISSRSSFLNRDLAKLYGQSESVPPETAERFQKVSLKHRHRAGLLGHASILTVSANGVETSPVTRGVWVLENLLGTPTPAPPDEVPAIEPDTRGAKTIRQQLEKHRQLATCNACHRKIDPPGFALECFDPVGRFRTHYDKKRRKAIDTSGTLPSGEAFGDVVDFREFLIDQERFLARHFCETLAAYALGRRIEAADHATLDRILDSESDKGYPLQSLLLRWVESEMFVAP
ncbi:MAG: DUF1588 domain-containing protein [Planctomycetota bacterium]